MGHNFSETNIDLNSEFVAPKSISDFLAEISAIDDSSQKLSKLNFLLQSLEDEANKIDAIRRELPLSTRLLSDAIEMVRGEALKLKGKEKFPAMEEFFPLKGNSEGGERAKGSIDQGEKKNWMSSSLLLNNPVTYDNFNIRKTSNQLFPKKPGDVGEGIQLFVPSKRKAAAVNAEEGPAAKKYGLPVHGLSLSPPAPPSAAAEKVAGDCDGSKMSKQEQRKQRRCWSPELHQRFVNALEKLGGAQAATPKQIREIMNVDGLTNDEVKSHLQKYRLHVRRLTESPPSSCSTWPQPYRVINALTEKARTGAQSGSPEGPLQLGLPGTREVSLTVTGLNAVEKSEEKESVRG